MTMVKRILVDATCSPQDSTLHALPVDVYRARYGLKPAAAAAALSLLSSPTEIWSM